MKVATFNGCKVYNLSDGKNLPQWISQNKKRALAKDEEHRRRLEIIQDFEMTTATQCLQMTGDKEHVVATGTYPPVVRCYTLSDMSMKFQRGLTAEVVAFETLSDNFGKMVFLQTDRNLNFHAPYGTHYSTRIPKFGRALQYHWSTCDLFVGASGDEVYRLNLEEGRFKEPLQLSYTGCNKMHINPAHPLLACGGETGVVEFWDLRSRRAVSTLPSPPPPGRPSERAEITAVKFDTDGLTLGVGTSDGRCMLYDIRSHQPVYTKEHQYGLPIVDVSFHRESGNVISTDKKLIKIWKRSGGDTGKILTNIEPSCDINSVLPVSDTRGSTGMIFVAGEQSKIMTYFVPQLGPAPRWCSYLEGITEELEEKSLDGGNGTTYEDYKFLTKTEVDSLGATGLIGTPMLRAYMHGFFIEMSLYSKLRAVSKPFEYEEHRKARIRDKVEERRQSRITAKKRLPSVNKQLAEKFLRKKGADGSEDAPGEGLVDDRFSALFKREEFEQDQESFDFRLRNPTLSTGKKRKGDNEEEDDLNAGGMFKAVEEDWDEDDYSEDDDGLDGQGSDSGDSIGNDVRYDSDDEPAAYASSKGKKINKKSNDKGAQDSDEEGAIGKATRRILAKRQLKDESRGGDRSTSKKKRLASAGPQMFELADGVAGERAVFAHTSFEKARRMEEKKLGQQLLTDRIKSLEEKSRKGGRDGDGTGTKILKTSEGLVRELTYMPQKSASNSDRLEKASKEELREEMWSSGRGGGRGGRGRGGRGGGGSRGRGGGRGKNRR